MTYAATPLIVAGALVATLHPTMASAQSMRTLSISRPVTAERLLHVTLDFNGGSVVLVPGRSGVLYGAKLRYDADRYTPIQEYDQRTGILRLGVQAAGTMGVRVDSRSVLAQAARFEFSPDIPLMIDATFGAADATIDLGGTNLTTLAISNSATHGTVDFSTPTHGSCRFAAFSVGASQLDVHHLAHANCAEVRVDGGAGGATLAFDGAWRRDMTLTVDLAMGSLTLRVPAGTGVRISGKRFLAPFDRNGFVKSGDQWITPGYQQAPHKLDVDLKASLVGIGVEWIR